MKTFAVTFIFVFLFATGSSALPKGVVTQDYAQFQDNAEAGFMQMVTIPDKASMSVLDDYGYLDVNKEKPFTGHAHTYAIRSFGQDARTGTGCFEAWPFDGKMDSDNYGNAFCISDSDMKYLFDHNAYTLGYDGY